jgi:hypothetical protein
MAPCGLDRSGRSTNGYASQRAVKRSVKAAGVHSGSPLQSRGLKNQFEEDALHGMSRAL